MRLPIVATKAHLGKTLHLDLDRETLTLVGPGGEELGSLSWESVINQVLAQTAPRESKGAQARTHQRISLTFHIQYSTPEGYRYEGHAGGIGIGGLFIESQTPLPVGTKVSMDFVLPDTPDQRVKAQGIVAWVCPKADQYTFSPGMGVRFTDLPPDTRKNILALVRSFPCKSNREVQSSTPP